MQKTHTPSNQVLDTMYDKLILIAACACTLTACLPQGGSGGGGGGGGVTLNNTTGGGGDGCGDGAINGMEECDGTQFGGKTCEGQRFGPGPLKCTSSCTIDTSACSAPLGCGDGELGTLEACEGFELRGETCESQGFSGGTLACDDRCQLDTSACVDTCGDGIVNGNDVCDDGVNDGSFGSCSSDCATTCDDDAPAGSGCDMGPPASGFRYVQILDSSPEDSCNSTSGQIDDNSDAGSDIMYAQLLDAQGQVIGYARAVDYVQGFNDNIAEIGYDRWETVFDGDTPELDVDGCPVENPPGSGDEFRQDTVVSLGCTGYLVVEFVDATDGTTVLNMQEGQRIDVGEFGPYCINSQLSEGQDTYDVYLCDLPEGVDPGTVDFNTECLIELGIGAQGQTAFDVPALPEP